MLKRIVDLNVLLLSPQYYLNTIHYDDDDNNVKIPPAKNKSMLLYVVIWED